MRSKPEAWALLALAGVAAIGVVPAGRPVALADDRKPVVVTRIYTGPDGLAHAEDIELDMNARGVTEMFKATGAQFSVRRPTPGAKFDPSGIAAADDPGWHTGPARQLVITLAGHSELEVSGGVHVEAGPGHINLIEDTTGKGHITRNFGPGDRIVLTIPLAEGVVIPGKRTPRSRASK